MGTNLGWTIGPALGGLLTLAMPYGYVFFFAAAGMIIAGFVARAVEDPVTRHSRPPAKTDDLATAIREATRDRRMRLLLAGTFLAALIGTQMFSTLAIYMTDELHLSKANVGLLYALNGAGVLCLQVPALALIQRFGIAKMLPLSSLLGAAAFALIGAASGFGGVAFVMVAITAAEVVFNPAHQTAIADAADPARRGRAYGVVGFVQMVGIALAPLVGGVLFDTIGDHHAAMWTTIGVIGLGQTLCFSAFVRRPRV
jgi:predicted MFS family arabinose efflux permease